MIPDEIIAIDPGKTSGFAHFEIDADVGPYPFLPVEMREVEWDGHWSFFLNLQQHLDDRGSDHIVVVVEDFRLYAHKAHAQVHNDFPSVQIIGVCKYITMIAGVELVLQMASCKRPFPDTEIRKWIAPEFEIPASLHIRDAIRHAQYHYFDQRIK